MKTATIRDLRNDFARLSKWLDQGETIEILKRGKAVADLVPKNGAKRKVLLGCTPVAHPLPDDVDDSVDAAWEAMK